MDFSKYNKGLRFYATLYNLEPDIFDNEAFVDIVGKNKELKIYYKKLYDQKIIKLLTENNYFYNEFYDYYLGVYYHCYLFKYKGNYESILNNIENNVNYTIPCDFYVKVCIHWKKYLDNTFITLTYESYNQ